MNLMDFFYMFLAGFMVLAPFFLFRKSSIQQIRNVDNFLFKWLISKNKAFGSSFHLAKFLLFFIGIYFFTQVSTEFFMFIFKSKGYNFYFAFVLFVVPYLFFLYIIVNVLIHIYYRKFVYLDEILKIFLLDYIIAFSSLLAEEWAFVPLDQIIKGALKHRNSSIVTKMFPDKSS